MRWLVGAPLARQDGDHQVALLGCSRSSGCFDSSLQVFYIVSPYGTQIRPVAPSWSLNWRLAPLAVWTDVLRHRWPTPADDLAAKIITGLPPDSYLDWRRLWFRVWREEWDGVTPWLVTISQYFSKAANFEFSLSEKHNFWNKGLKYLTLCYESINTFYVLKLTKKI